MRSNWKAVGLAMAIAICCAAAYATQSGAADEKSMVVQPPANAPAQRATEMPAPATSTPTTEAPATATSAECCTTPCIKYWTHLGARLMLRCNSQIQVTMSVDNPADCRSCQVEIPMCIPCCCMGEPTVTSDCGLLGRGIVEYCWPCGFKATVVFRPTLGDVIVHYSA